MFWGHLFSRADGLSCSYGLKAAADAAGFYNDIAMDSFARENPEVSFIHAAPGGVKYVSFFSFENMFLYFMIYFAPDMCYQHQLGH